MLTRDLPAKQKDDCVFIIIGRNCWSVFLQPFLGVVIGGRSGRGEGGGGRGKGEGELQRTETKR